ncbi:MAG: 4-alpha-glucanotransferase [Microbacteriaceae bacterium]|nr:4-alpha-glucanotransferase [Microbacteriaceae bacterium]
MTAPTRTPELLELAARYGVATDYHDWRGEHVDVSAETLIAVLRALDVDATTDEGVRDALTALDERPWRRGAPATTVVVAGSGADVAVHVPDGAAVEVVVALESGEERSTEQIDNWTPPREVDGVRLGEASFRLPDDLPLGWHRVVARIAADAAPPEAAELLGYAALRGRARRRNRGEAEAPAETAPAPLEASGALIVAPAAPSRTVDEAGWGLMAQLYQARSAGSWGIGDLADLRAIGEWGAGRGAGFVLVNPFHAPSPVTPIEPSPYLPTSRRFMDPSIIRIDDAAAGLELEPQVAQRLDELASYAKQQNAADVIDRDAAWLAKREALGHLFVAARAQGGERWNDFGRYVDEQGEGLIDFATWSALCEQAGPAWQDWPEELRDPRAETVEAFRQQHADRVEFYCWVQFVIREQSDATQRALREAGMPIGVMHDLAVGVHPSGADAWALRGELARGVSVGAPPDAFNQLGQNWSQPPLRPDALERTGYAPLRDMLRASFAGAGALRIDHILGLFRLWWIPEGAGADEGTYIAYDHEATLGVLLLEAERAGALVVGEDLGVVSDLTREQMAARRIYGTQIMWFEQEPDGAPKRPEHYREECLATVTTHDLPPTAGYLELAHVALRDRLGLLTRPVEEELASERALLDGYVRVLREEGLVGDAPTTEELVEALHRRMAGCASRLFGVALADLAGDRRSINQPGTYREHPNWTLPLADPDGRVLPLEELLASPLAARLAEASQRR